MSIWEEELDGADYELLKNGLVLATLRGKGNDFPHWLFKFEPTPAWEEFRKSVAEPAPLQPQFESKTQQLILRPLFEGGIEKNDFIFSLVDNTAYVRWKMFEGMKPI
jgi:hypothetical protein